MIKTIEKAPIKEESGWYNRIVTRTPVFWIDSKGKEHFVKCRRSDCGNKYDEERSAEEIKRMLEILESNGCRYMPHYLKDRFTYYPVEDAENFLEWKKEKGYTFNRQMVDKIEDEEDGSIIFHGNLNEYSAAFYFVIYDRKLIERWNKALADDGIVIRPKK